MAGTVDVVGPAGHHYARVCKCTNSCIRRGTRERRRMRRVGKARRGKEGNKIPVVRIICRSDRACSAHVNPMGGNPRGPDLQV